jgi:hypothetical protein
MTMAEDSDPDAAPNLADESPDELAVRFIRTAYEHGMRAGGDAIEAMDVAFEERFGDSEDRYWPQFDLVYALTRTAAAVLGMLEADGVDVDRGTVLALFDRLALRASVDMAARREHADRAGQAKPDDDEDG